MSHYETPAIDDRWLSRLADGELTPAQLATMIALLDATPASWRTCALRLIEEQSLARECRMLVASSSAAKAAESISVLLPADVAIPRRKRSFPTLLAVEYAVVAAAVLLALTMGYLGRGWIEPTTTAAPLIVEQSPKSRGEKDSPRAEIVSKEGSSEATDEVLVADSANDRSEDAGQSPDAIHYVGSLNVRVDDQEVTKVPVYDSENLPDSWYAAHQPAFSDQMIEALERQGQEVRRHVTYMPVKLNDGRAAVLPVEGLEVKPVARFTY